MMKRDRTRWLAGVVAAIVMMLGAPPPAAAGQSQKQEPPKKKQKKEKKPKKPRAADVAEQPAPDEPIDPQIDFGGKGPRVGWKQHPSFRVGSWFRLDYEMKMQEDGHASFPGAANFTPWELHRNRVGVSGYVTKRVDFEVEYELTEKELQDKDIARGALPRSQWKDVDVNVHVLPTVAQVRAGKFKIPFGLDEMTGVTHSDFVYRSLGASYLDPARDIGVMVHGRVFKRGLNYWVGRFQHDGDNAQTHKEQGGDNTVAARVTGAPLRVLHPMFKNLEIGGAIAVSDVSDQSFLKCDTLDCPNGLRGRTVVTQDYFFESVYVNGKRKRYEADADWTAGPVSARAEYTLQLDNRIGEGTSNQTLSDARGRAWYLAGTWLVTGEKKKRPVKPESDLFLGGFGAVELAARVERLWFDSVGDSGGVPYRSPRAIDILPASDRVLTFGVNWMPNRFMKLQLNAIHEQLDGLGDRQHALTKPVPDQFWSKVVRFQLVL